MNRTSKRLSRLLPAFAAVGSAAVLLSGAAARAQTIPNPSFEADTFTVYPGYISDQTPPAITGWTVDAANGAGLNPAGGSPFADNGAVPAGNQVAFIQSGANTAATTLSTTISGLTVGTTYKVTLRANARGGQAPNLRILLDGTEVMAMSIHSAGGANPYWYIAFELTATATSQVLGLMNDTLTDNTLLVDDLQIAPSSGRWVVDAWNDDASSGLDSSLYYTHAYKFGNNINFTINGVPFTGLGGNSPAVAGSFSTTWLSSGPANQPNNITGDSAQLANNFDYGYSIPVGSSESITLNGLTPGTEYVATIFSYAWDDPGLDARWATFSVGDDRLTVQQDQFGLNNGIRISYRYTADNTGTATLNFTPVNNAANVSFHVCGFCNREAVSRNVAPIIVAQPQTAVVSPGLTVNFTVVANGLPAPTYQWRFNGADIGGAQDATYTVAAASDLTAGNYDVVVSNSVGLVTSAVARLVVGMALANPSFELDSFSAWPGYCGNNNTGGAVNGPITGWTLDAPTGGGINPIADSRSPFADNGTIPNGAQVAFIQGETVLHQTVSGFTVGEPYSVHYYENARSGPTPGIEVRVGGATVLAAHAITPVGSGPYYEVYSDVFTATNTDLELAFVKSSPGGGDSTALLDNVTVVHIAPGTAPFVTRNPRPVLLSVADSASFWAQGVGSPPLAYQWLKNGADLADATTPVLTLDNIQKPAEADYSLRITNNFGSVTSAAAHLTVYEPIPDLFNTGVDSNRVAVADGATDPHYQIIVNPDTGSTDAIVEDSTVFPISTGAWLADTATSRWIGPQFNTVGSAGGSYTYRIVIDLTDRDPSTLVIQGQWASDNAGQDIQVNGHSTGNPKSLGMTYYTGFAIYGTNTSLNWVAGPNNLDFIVQNDALGYTGLRVEIIRSNLRIPPGIPPTITTPPVSQTAVVGDTITFTAAARGTAPLSYQWEKDGAAIPGQTTLTLVLTNVTDADSGSYLLNVSNSVGSTNSQPAILVVCRPIPGVVFGTGVANDGTLLPAGVTDPHYILSVSADPSYVGPDAIVVNNRWPIQSGVWVVNGPDSEWIAPMAAAYNGNYEGSYTYETSFDLTGYDLSSVRIVGAWALDNSGTDILVNGVSSGLTCGAFSSFTPFTLTKANGLVAGKNILDFLVNNAPATPNPTGLRVDLKAVVPIVPGTPPMFMRQPLSVIDAAVGQPVTFTASAIGSSPLSYQWNKNGANIPGAASPTLAITNCYYTDAGSYAVVVTNAAGSVTSAAATLTVMPPPTFANLTNGLVLHLTFEGNQVTDSSGRGNDGTANGQPTFVPGRLGASAIYVNTDPSSTTFNYVSVGPYPDLAFGLADSFSVAFWVKYTGLPNDLPMIGTAINSTWQFGWVFTDDAGKIECSLADTANEGTYLRDPLAGSPVTHDGNWHQVTGVCDRGLQRASVYVDGVLAESWSIVGLGTLDSGNPVIIGQDPTGVYGVAGAYTVDDVGVWRRALEAHEAASIYAAGQRNQSFNVYGPVLLNMRPLGTNIDLTWQAGTLLWSTSVSGPYDPVPGATAPFYRTNAAGAAMFFRVKL